tara:strand:+ start:30139 stop:30774 length:636 start_codon:yes stop_codon:yes gene_type:complete
MFALYTFTFVGIVTYVLNKAYNYLNTYKTFEDTYEHDEYKLLCYRIILEDASEILKSELTDEQIVEIDESSDIKIKCIIIEYMYNGKLMKYITYTKDIRFPIYNFDIAPTTYPYYPDIIILNGMDVTKYIEPWLGPYCNFYIDREEPIKLQDALMDHPDYEDIDFDNGHLLMISNETPLEGRKCISKILPCKLIWKRHAAVDPRDEHLLKD